MATARPQNSSQLSQILDGYGLSVTFNNYRSIVFMYLTSAIAVDDADGERCYIPVGSKRDALCPLSDTESDIDIITNLKGSVFDETESDKAKCFISSNTNSKFPVYILERGPKPGYKYLKCLADGTESNFIYTHFRGCRYVMNTNKTDLLNKGACNDEEEEYEVHGPAISGVVPGDLFVEFDAVIALHCPSLPTDFDEWCNRKRDRNWPPERIIETTKQYGCLLVGVGHPASHTQIIEWRLSLTKTEYLLTKSFNHIQLKCYVLMKLVLKWIIQPQIKEPLSSYHVKTVMFWMAEEQEKQFWIPENLVDCFMKSLVKLRTFVKNKDCPNYFLTNVNLLEGKLEGDIHQRVLGILDNIIAEGPTVVYRCLPLNAHMNGAGCRHLIEESCTCLHKHLLQERLGEIANAGYAREGTVSTPVNERTYRSSQFGLVDWHVVNEVHNQSIPDSHTFSSLSVCEGMGLPNKGLYFFQRDYIAKLRGNGHVARIKLATFFYHRRRFSYCLPLLSLVISSMESSREFEVCTEEEAGARDIVEIDGVECIYLTQNNKGFRVSEIVFGPCDKLLIPPDLQDAMRRPKTVNGTYYEGWVFVDSIVYAYYLLIVTLHAMRRYRGITSLFTRFRKVCNQQPGAIRIFRKDMADRLYEHAYILLWRATKGFTKLS